MAMGAPIRLLLVEDNDVFRDAMVFLLDRRDEVEVVGAIAHGSSAATICAKLRADVVVIDYRLPDVDGSTAAADVLERCPGSAVVFLSASAGAEEREASRMSGATLVRKDEGVDALLEAVVNAARRRDRLGSDD
jgi:DNA-binding NarL/FixJ family response regulator